MGDDQFAVASRTLHLLAAPQFVAHDMLGATGANKFEISHNFEPGFACHSPEHFQRIR
jgi:hypothetical protein